MTLRAIAPVIFFIGVSNVLGIQIMVPLGHDSHFSHILVTAALVNLGIFSLFGAIWKAVGGAVAVTITETFVTAAMFLILIHKGFFRELRFGTSSEIG